MLEGFVVPELDWMVFDMPNIHMSITPPSFTTNIPLMLLSETLLHNGAWLPVYQVLQAASTHPYFY